MKKILVPTDFSENAKSAFEYALKLADNINATVEVIHIYHPSVQPIEGFIAYPKTEIPEFLEKRMHEFIENCFDKSIEDILLDEGVSYRIEFGFATHSIVEFSKTEEYEMIVMGTTGTTGKAGILEKLFGKVSFYVAQQAVCPVILIPAGVQFEPIKEIIYASEHESADEEILDELQKIVSFFDAKIHLVHVYDEDEKQPEGVGYFLLEKSFHLKAPALKFAMDSVSSDSVAHGLEKFAEEKEMDLMVIVQPKRNFWQRLIHKNRTNEMVMNPQLPIMVMH
jgi:nucleotide-binding universal stress UspA family protein